MAKKSSIEKNERRKKLTARYAVKRRAFKAVIQNPKSTIEEKLAAQTGLRNCRATQRRTASGTAVR